MPRTRSELLAAGMTFALGVFAVALWLLRVSVWLMSPLLGLLVSTRHGRRKRHRELLGAIQAEPRTPHRTTGDLLFAYLDRRRTAKENR
jgi:hypothetical protein